MKFFFLSSYLMFFKILNVIFYSYESHSIYFTLVILHLISSSDLQIPCMFDKMGWDIHGVESRRIQKLIPVYHKIHLIQIKILSDDS